MLICTSGYKNKNMKIKRYGSDIFPQKCFMSFAINYGAFLFFFSSLTLILSVLLTPELGTSHKTVKDITLLKSILNPDIPSIIATKLIKLYLPIINCHSVSHQSENMLLCA